MIQATVATHLAPGDYVLTFMDWLIEGGIELIGTCNELNAGWLGRKPKRGFYDYRGEKPMPTR